jgi:hypothetical protein
LRTGRHARHRGSREDGAAEPGIRLETAEQRTVPWQPTSSSCLLRLAPSDLNSASGSGMVLMDADRQMPGVGDHSGAEQRQRPLQRRWQA